MLKLQLRFKIFLLTLLILNNGFTQVFSGGKGAGASISFVNQPNNNIYKSTNSGDGFTTFTFLNSNNIYKGYKKSGFAVASFLNSTIGIYCGSKKSGFALASILATTSYYKGNYGDGSFSVSLNYTSGIFLYKGNNGDGYSIGQSVNASNIYKGNKGRGYFSSFLSSVSLGLYKGGNADGYASDSMKYCFNRIGTPSISGSSFYYFGDTIKLYGTIVNGATGYKWKGPNNFTANGLNMQRPNANVSTTGMYMLYAYRNGNTECDTSFSGVIYVTSAPLPVKLTFLAAKLLNNSESLISWTTAQEINNSHFDIERSTDLVNWYCSGSIKGNGNSNIEFNYSFKDDISVVPNQYKIIYYRLKQFDFDGQSNYSKIVAVERNYPLEQKIIVYPNPSSGIFTFENKSMEDCEVQLFDINGKLVDSFSVLASGKILLDYSLFTNGLYLVKVNSINKIENIKIIIAK